MQHRHEGSIREFVGKTALITGATLPVDGGRSAPL
jgi:hypothetical protein